MLGNQRRKEGVRSPDHTEAPAPLWANLQWTELGIRPQVAPGRPSRAVFPEEPRVMGLPGMATCLPPDGPEPETRCPPPPALGSRMPLMWESRLCFYFDPDQCLVSLDRLFHISDLTLHSCKMGQ